MVLLVLIWVGFMSGENKVESYNYESCIAELNKLMLISEKWIEKMKLEFQKRLKING
jgi:hypothetical protein